jgi:hypothetical protein
MERQVDSSQVSARIFVDFESDALPEDEFSILGETIYRRKIAGWRDPFTLPNTRLTCLREVRIPGDGYVCVEFKTEYQWLYVDLFVVVVVATPYDLKSIVEECLKQSAIAAAIAAIIVAVGSGGAALAAAKEVFLVAFQACLVLKIKQGDLLSVRLEDKTYRGGWE